MRTLHDPLLVQGRICKLAGFTGSQLGFLLSSLPPLDGRLQHSSVSSLQGRAIHYSSLHHQWQICTITITPRHHAPAPPAPCSSGWHQPRPAWSAYTVPWSSSDISLASHWKSQDVVLGIETCWGWKPSHQTVRPSLSQRESSIARMKKLKQQYFT